MSSISRNSPFTIHNPQTMPPQTDADADAHARADGPPAGAHRDAAAVDAAATASSAATPTDADAHEDATAAPAPRAALPVPIDIRSASLFVLAVVACIFVLHEMQPVVVPIVLSALIFYALAPIVGWLVRWHVPRAMAALLVMTALVGGTGGIAYVLSDEVAAVMQTMPQTADRLRRQIRGLQRQNGDSFAQMQKAAMALEQTASDAIGRSITPRGVMRVQIEQPSFRVGEFLMSGSIGAFALMGQIGTVFFLTLFMLISSPRLRRIAVEATGPTLSKKRITLQIVDEITRQVQHFLVILLATGTLVAVATTLALWWMGLQYPLLWGIAAGVANSVPYFGPVAVGVGLGAVALVQFGTFAKAALVAGVAVAITALEGFLLTPIWQGRAAQMNSVAVFVGLLFWSWMWGPIGLLLAVPLTTVVKVVCDHVEPLQPVGRLLGE